MTFLGTGSGAPSSDGRGHSAAILTSHDRAHASFLFDAGEGAARSLTSSNALNYNFLLSGGIFISHLHGDHAYGLPAVITTVLQVRSRSDDDVWAVQMKKESRAKARAAMHPMQTQIAAPPPPPPALRVFGPPGLHRFLNAALGMTQSNAQLSRMA